MKIAYSGHRYISDYDLDILNATVRRDMRDPDVDEMFFGGAIGCDSHLLRFAYLARTTRKTPIFTVVCPDTLERLPKYAKSCAKKYADRIVELHHPIQASDGWLAFRLRNHWMVDQIKDCGQLNAFWSGRESGGTWDAIQYARSVDACWEHIQIRGEEPPQ